MEPVTSAKSLTERLANIDHLPALPSTVVRLIGGLNSDSGADELEAIVRTDEAISAAVLRMANSAAQGQTDRAFTLQESIARLGSRALQRIAISLQSQSVMSGGCAGFGLVRGQLWAGALGGATAAELIAKRTQHADPGVCFVAGLLRDIGKLAMDQLVGATEMVKVFSSLRPGVSQMELEIESFGLQHPEIGAELATLWGLPDEIVAAIRFHHDPDAAVGASDDGASAGSGEDQRVEGVTTELQAICDVVHCGDAIAMMLGLGVGNDGLSYPISARARSAVGLSRRTVEELMPIVRAGTAQLTLEACEEAS